VNGPLPFRSNNLAEISLDKDVSKKNNFNQGDKSLTEIQDQIQSIKEKRAQYLEGGMETKYLELN
jgi:hypothetical protein